MTYPDYPKNRLIVGGVDLTMRFKMVLLDGYELNPPAPKTYTVDIPGGDGVIDLTTALTGDVVYENRSQKFTFACIKVEDFENVKMEVSNFLHGRAFDYQITMDPEYTYHGRFTVETYTHQMYANGRLGLIEISVDAEPYKLKKHCVYKLDGTGGQMFRLESGRKPVHPTIECEVPCQVTWKDELIIVPAGTYRLNNVLFQDGYNEIYINSRSFWNITWDEIGEDGTHEMTWGSAATYRWDDIQRLGGDVEDIPRKWEDVALTRWSELASTAWSSISSSEEDVKRTYVYLTYDWKDL